MFEYGTTTKPTDSIIEKEDAYVSLRVFNLRGKRRWHAAGIDEDSRQECNRAQKCQQAKDNRVR